MGDTIIRDFLAKPVQAVFRVFLALAADIATAVIAAFLPVTSGFTRGVFAEPCNAELAHSAGPAFTSASIISTDLSSAVGLAGILLADTFSAREARIAKAAKASAAIVSTFLPFTVQGA